MAALKPYCHNALNFSDFAIPKSFPDTEHTTFCLLKNRIHQQNTCVSHVFAIGIATFFFPVIKLLRPNTAVPNPRAVGHLALGHTVERINNLHYFVLFII